MCGIGRGGEDHRLPESASGGRSRQRADIGHAQVPHHAATRERLADGDEVDVRSRCGTPSSRATATGGRSDVDALHPMARRQLLGERFDVVASSAPVGDARGDG